MWKKLDKYSAHNSIYPGCIIAMEPDDTDAHYYFKEVYLGFVLAINKNNNYILKVFHLKHLETGEWFVKMFD